MMQLSWLGTIAVIVCLLVHWFGMKLLTHHSIKVELVFGIWVALSIVYAIYLVKSPASLVILRRHNLKKFCLTALLMIGLALMTMGRIQVRLDDRLDAKLEGKSLTIVGVVSEMPVRSDETTRFLFTVESMSLVDQALGKFPSLIRLSWSGLYAKKTLEKVPEKVPKKPPKNEPSSELTSFVHESHDAAADTPEFADVTTVSALRAGQRWRFEVRLKRPVGLVNPDTFDSELKALQNAIAATGYIRRAQLVTPFVFSIGNLIERLRDQTDRAISDVGARINPRVVGLIRALTVGNQQAIDRDDWTMFNRTGVSHLMSISGLHITMLAALAGKLAGGLWGLIARYCPAKQLPFYPSKLRFQWIFALFISLIYSLIAGWEVPSQRTWYCLAVAGLLVQSGRKVSFWLVLQVVALVIVVIDPWAVMSAGFWLSFGAVAAIVWVNQNHQSQAGQTPQRLAWLREAARSQWACTLSLIPLLVLLFGTVSLVGPIANALAIPVVSFVITPLALISAVLALWFEQPSLLFMQAIALVADPMLGLLSIISQWQFASWTSAKPPFWLTGLGLIGTACCLAPFTRRTRLPAMMAIVACLITRYQAPDLGTWRMSILDVGQGAAAVIESGGQIVVVDAGPSDAFNGAAESDAAKRVLIPWLQSKAIHQIDTLVLSNSALGYAGGAASLVAHIAPQVVHASLNQGSVLAQTLPNAESCLRGRRWKMNQLTFEYLHPPAIIESKVKSLAKTSSCVLRIDGPKNRVLITSAIEAAQEERLLQLFDADQLKSNVILIPNHGSKSGSSMAFVEAVGAHYAIASNGYRNRFKFPHDQTIKRYEDAGAQMLRTDIDGALTLLFAADGTISVTRARQHAAPYWRIPIMP